MRSLEYRSPRVHADFDVDFITGEDMFRGTCVDVSETGLRARFKQHVPVGSVGTLIVHHPLCRTTIPVRVVYMLKDKVGFDFFEVSPHDQEVLGRLMSILGI